MTQTSFKVGGRAGQERQGSEKKEMSEKKELGSLLFFIAQPFFPQKNPI